MSSGGEKPAAPAAPSPDAAAANARPAALPLSALACLAPSLQCPVCLDVLTDPLTTPCGHAYCAACVSRALEARPACPTCGAHVQSASACTPSHALRTLASTLGPAALAAAAGKAAAGGGGGGGEPPDVAATAPAPAAPSGTAAAVWALLERGEGGGGGGGAGGAAASAPSASDLLPPVDDLSPADLDALISGLIARRAARAARDAAADLKLLLRFLRKARATQAARLAAAQSEVAAVDADLAWVAAKVARGGDGGEGGGSGAAPAALAGPPAQLLLEGGPAGAAAGGGGPPPPPPTSTHLTAVDPAVLKAGKRRLADAFDDLQECYLALRREREAGERVQQAGDARPTLTADGDGGGGGGGDAAQAVVPSGAAAGAGGSTALVPVGPGCDHQAAEQQAPPPPPPPPPATGGPGPALAEVSRLLAVCVRAGRLTHVAALPAAGATSPTASGGSGAGPGAAPAPPPAASSIISSVEFDASAGRFATAGVAKQVAVWDLAAVLDAAAAEREAALDQAGRAVRAGSPGSPSPSAPPPPRHARPAVSLAARAKLSCLSWARAPGGPTHLLASADYEGGVTLWDVATGTALVEYDAHDRRAWSVDFCPVLGGGSAGGGGGGGPTLFATASDDGTARIWCARSRAPVATLAVGANVCCARFAPPGMAGRAAAAGCELATGSADHLARVFDLRAAGRGPLAVLAGHGQAVSYVRYAPGGPGLVSASTDATLRLWRRGWADGEAEAEAGGHAARSPPPPSKCVRVYRGHANERNFVGLDAAGDLVAAGSETGEVVVYAAALSRPIARAVCDGRGDGFGGFQAAPVPGGLPAPPAFVSAVCWRPATGDEAPGPAGLPRTLLAATSRGSVHVLELGAW